MNITTANFGQNYSYRVHLDIETALYSLNACYQGKLIEKTYPYGTTKKDVMNDIRKIFI